MRIKQVVTILLLSIGICGQVPAAQDFGIPHQKDPDENLTVGGQPSLEQLHALTEAGYTSVINLRRTGEFDDFAEGAEVERLGMNYAHIPVANVASISPSDAREGPTACAGPESHRFDFWAGKWDVESEVRTPGGEWAVAEGTWEAEEILGGCAFIDFAEGDFGRGPMRGMGSRYFEPSSGTWFITWLSTHAPGRLGIWEGGFKDDGTASFLREVTTPKGTIQSRIRWWDIRQNHAEWEHAVSRDGGENWQPTWRMTFRRAAADMSETSGSAEALPRPQTL